MKPFLALLSYVALLLSFCAPPMFLITIPFAIWAGRSFVAEVRERRAAHRYGQMLASERAYVAELRRRAQ